MLQVLSHVRLATYLKSTCSLSFQLIIEVSVGSTKIGDKILFQSGRSLSMGLTSGPCAWFSGRSRSNLNVVEVPIGRGSRGQLEKDMTQRESLQKT